MPAMRFLLMPIRTNKQGVQINVGKDGDEYKAIVNTMTMHPDDMKELGVASGATITPNGPKRTRASSANSATLRPPSGSLAMSRGPICWKPYPRTDPPPPE